MSARYGKFAQLDQRITVFAGRQHFQALDGTLHVVTRQLGGVVQCTRRLDRRANLLEVFQATLLIAWRTRAACSAVPSRMV